MRRSLLGLRLANALLSAPLVGCAALRAPSAAPRRCRIERSYAPFRPSQWQRGEEEPPPLPRILCEVDPVAFPSPSQARRAIRHGRLLVLRSTDYLPCPSTPNRGVASNKTMLELGSVADTSTQLRDMDILALRSRLPNEFYSQSCTKYVDPPPNEADLAPGGNAILYEDDHIAIVNKPELLDTIGATRDDLQSLLPFVLHPPTLTHWSSGRGNTAQECYLPRPIHRLDRRTSGCVLVAKSTEAMKRFSKLFCSRQIRKSYCAVVFGEPKVKNSPSVDIDGKKFHVIDYPIDGKDAITLWRVVAQSTSPTWGKVSLLHLLPKTGRTHQIRRHLSYCLSCPIVGDSKYDGGAFANARKLGMFLCSNSMEFVHAMDDEKRIISVDIPLPDKFSNLLGMNGCAIEAKLSRDEQFQHAPTVVGQTRGCATEANSEMSNFSTLRLQ
ncbi:hypothetical protein ACHAWF_007061 [Thalassiosira exigua]